MVDSICRGDMLMPPLFCVRFGILLFVTGCKPSPPTPTKVKSPSRQRHNRIRCSRYCLSSLTSNLGLSTCLTASSNQKKRRRHHDHDRRHHHHSRQPHHNSGSDDFCAEEAYWTQFLPSLKRVDLDPLVCGRPSLPLCGRHSR